MAAFYPDLRGTATAYEFIFPFLCGLGTNLVRSSQVLAPVAAERVLLLRTSRAVSASRRAVIESKRAPGTAGVEASQMTQNNLQKIVVVHQRPMASTSTGSSPAHETRMPARPPSGKRARGS